MGQALVRIGEVVVSAKVAADIARTAKARQVSIEVVVSEFRAFQDWVGHKMSWRALV